jgi:hypothetical protein
MTEDPEEQWLDEIVSTLSNVADVRQRGYALAERLSALNVDLIVDAIRIIRDKAFKGDAGSLRLYNALTLSAPLSAALGKEKLSEVTESARRRGEFQVVAILAEIPSKYGYDRPHQPFLDAPLKEIPVGTRKYLARKPDIRLMQRIAKDQDYRVIEHLLNNPRMTESEVIKIASTRPTSPEVLETIAKHPRWGCRYRVKKTIVLNPYTPLSLAFRLVAYMSFQDLELLCSLSEVSHVLLAEAEKLLQKKAEGMPEDYDD